VGRDLLDRGGKEAINTHIHEGWESSGRVGRVGRDLLDRGG
jgi:hypothetical protein